MSIFRWLEYHPTKEEKKKYKNVKKELWPMITVFTDENVKCFDVMKGESVIDKDLSMFLCFLFNIAKEFPWFFNSC
jgi:hypothetical protein